MPIIKSKLGSQIGKFFASRAYWAVKLRDDRWLCELDKIPDVLRKKDITRPGEILIADFRGPGKPTDRELDWSLDIVGTGDNALIKELWLFCPPSRISPMGNTATLRFLPHETKCAFVLKRGSVYFTHRQLDYLIIGKVTDKQTGDCTCFIWDEQLKVMSSPYQTNVSDFTAWRPGIMPIGKLALDVLGLDVR